MDYSKMTQEDFDEHLEIVLADLSAFQLISEVPNIHGEVAEHFNNDVLDSWASNQEDSE